ncbi:MAG: DUF6569 family protein [Planctomycetota bacterium]
MTARTLAFAGLALATLFPAVGHAADAPAAPAAAPKPEDVVAASLGALKLGEGLVAQQVILFPLILETPPPVLEIVPGLGGATLAFEEPAAGVEKVKVKNVAPKDALLLAGTVLEGGLRDRVVREDVLLPAGASADVATVPGSMSTDRRKEAKPFKVADFLAPPYLRDSALFRTASASITSKFISHFLEFRNEGDKRRSLAAVGGSDTLAEYCLPCQRSMAQWPDKREAGFVVGGIAVVRGRVQALDVFATNALLLGWFSPLLKSLSFPAAAIELRAKKAGVALPGGDDPKAVLDAATAAAKAIAAGLSKATLARRELPAGAVGDLFTVTLPDGERGTALVRDGALLHLSLYPRDAFEYGLYAQPLVPLEGEDVSGTDDDTLDPFAQRAKIGARMTEQERRLLERLRGGNR